MTITETTTLTPAHKTAILRLWNNEYPAKLCQTEDELEQYFARLVHKHHFFLKNETDEILGWLFVFERDDEDWFAMILDSSIHGRGYGTKMLDVAKQKVNVLHGWATDHDRDIKADGSTYRSPLPFYLKNSFEMNPETRLELEKLSAVKISWRK
ncbi:MAG: GNAT family N-acetyltransferase [Bacteroidota bacterium]